MGHFFGCHNCGQNFQKETENMLKEVTKPYDEVKFLWKSKKKKLKLKLLNNSSFKAHNSVNKRLAGDETEDPSFPKKQFPTIDKCPQCYKNSTDSNNQTLFDINETMKYLLSFYSIYGIEGEEELDQKSSDYFATKITTKRLTVSRNFTLPTAATNATTTSATTIKEADVKKGSSPAAVEAADEVEDLHYNVEMVDLESSLNYIFRNEITRSEVIEGENYSILKRWIKILSKVN
jgi:hypothetical protein